MGQEVVVGFTSVVRLVNSLKPSLVDISTIVTGDVNGGVTGVVTGEGCAVGCGVAGKDVVVVCLGLSLVCGYCVCRVELTPAMKSDIIIKYCGLNNNTSKHQPSKGSVLRSV